MDSPHLHRFVLFETASLFILSGSDKARSAYRLLAIDRQAANGELKCWEENDTFSAVACQHRINLLIQRSGHSVDRVTTFAGLLGFMRLPELYLIMIVKIERVGQIGGRWIYNITDWRAKAVANPALDRSSSSSSSSSTDRYRSLLRGLDLTKDFFFSYYYDLTHTLQHNMASAGDSRVDDFSAGLSAEPLTRQRGQTAAPVDGANAGTGPGPRAYWSAPDKAALASFPAYNEQFLWNYYLSRDFLRLLPHCSYWLVPLIHGFFQQHAFSVGPRQFLLSLIARRSRHFAGTRYLRRGLDASGHVANEVESEQIVEEQFAYSEGLAAFSSVVIVRGSIPLYWSQENIKTMKPDIVVSSFDRSYQASVAHLRQLFQRYGGPVGIVNLIKQRDSQETRLGEAFVDCVRAVQPLVNADPDTGKYNEAPADPFPTDPLAQLGDPRGALSYRAYDFINQRSARANVLSDLRALIKPLVDRHGIFARMAPTAANTKGKIVSKQGGVIRVNCVDCLDRTNVAQFCVGRYSLLKQLKALRVLADDARDFPHSLLAVLQHLYTNHGDRIAHQYAGSGAMHKDALFDKDARADDRKAGADDDGGKKAATGKSASAAGMASNALSAVRRYYSNNVTDVDKQFSIHLFLGNFIPSPGKADLWTVDPAAPLTECDNIYGSNNTLFKLAYRADIACERVKASDATFCSHSAGAFTNSDLLARACRLAAFQTFFNERYNPKALTEYDKELQRPFAKALAVAVDSAVDEASDSEELDEAFITEDADAVDKTPASPQAAGSQPPSPGSASIGRSTASTSPVPSSPAVPLMKPPPARGLFSSFFKKGKKENADKKSAKTSEAAQSVTPAADTTTGLSDLAALLVGQPPPPLFVSEPAAPPALGTGSPAVAFASSGPPPSAFAFMQAADEAAESFYKQALIPNTGPTEDYGALPAFPSVSPGLPSSAALLESGHQSHAQLIELVEEMRGQMHALASKLAVMAEQASEREEGQHYNSALLSSSSASTASTGGLMMAAGISPASPTAALRLGQTQTHQQQLQTQTHSQPVSPSVRVHGDIASSAAPRVIDFTEAPQPRPLAQPHAHPQPQAFLFDGFLDQSNPQPVPTSTPAPIVSAPAAVHAPAPASSAIPDFLTG